MKPIFFEDWGPGWTALAFTLLFGITVIFRSWQVRRATTSIKIRVLIAGSRGKSGTVRIIHGILKSSGLRAVGKITGTVAIELTPDGTEETTMRLGSIGIPEMRSALIRGHRWKAEAAVLECMAVQPEMISLVAKIVQPQVIVIPTIRLDHLEDEGLTEFEIGMAVLRSLGKAEHLVTAVQQPDLIREYGQYCVANQMQFHHVVASVGQPAVIGHHPTNVALGLEVAKILQLTPNGFEQQVSTEPESAIRRNVELGGRVIGFCDLGGANDPESAAEAMARLGFTDSELVIPIIINRWDRPFRAVSFLAAVDGNFPMILISGPLDGYGKRLIHKREPQTIVASLTPELAEDFPKLIDYLELHNPQLIDRDLCLVSLENTHDRAAEILRDYFQQNGSETTIGDWGVRP